MLKAILCIIVLLAIGRIFSGVIVSALVMFFNALFTLPIIPFLLVILGIFLILGILKNLF